MKRHLERLRAGALEKSEFTDEFREAYPRESGRFFEALLAKGDEGEAMNVAEEVTRFEPSGNVFATLIRAARRAGASNVATRLRKKANEILPQAERVPVDRAYNEPAIDRASETNGLK